MTMVTAPSLAYIATQVRIAIVDIAVNSTSDCLPPGSFRAEFFPGILSHRHSDQFRVLLQPRRGPPRGRKRKGGSFRLDEVVEPVWPTSYLSSSGKAVDIVSPATARFSLPIRITLDPSTKIQSLRRSKSGGDLSTQDSGMRAAALRPWARLLRQRRRIE